MRLILNTIRLIYHLVWLIALLVLELAHWVFTLWRILWSKREERIVKIELESQAEAKWQ